MQILMRFALIKKANLLVCSIYSVSHERQQASIFFNKRQRETTHINQKQDFRQHALQGQTCSHSNLEVHQIWTANHIQRSTRRPRAAN